MITACCIQWTSKPFRISSFCSWQYRAASVYTDTDNTR